MIVFGKVNEPKVASATSTYPAIITCVENIGDRTTGLVKLSFYCPATMSGHPLDAAYMGSNIVEAPVTPHNGANRYDFQEGGVICISYANGNLNTPQFVRYVNVTEDTITWNKSILRGAAIPSDDAANIDYTKITASEALSSDRLAKAVALMPIMRSCASGNNKEQYYSFVNGAGTIMSPKDRAYNKVGLYGAEFICEDFPNNTSGARYEWDFTKSHTGSRKLAQKHSFLEICSYLITCYPDVSTVSPDCIIEDLKQSNIKGVDIINADSHALATYLFLILSGLPRLRTLFPDNVGKIYPPGVGNEEYNENVLANHTDRSNEEKFSSLTNCLNNVYCYSDDEHKNWYSSWWNRFTDTYEKELEKCYTIILNDNMQKLANRYNVRNWSNVMFAIMSVVATAWPLLENAIVNTKSVFDENYYYGQFLTTTEEYLYDNIPASSFDDAKRGEIAKGYADCYVRLLSRDWEGVNENDDEELKNLKNWVTERIQISINLLLTDWDKISQILSKTAGYGEVDAANQGTVANEKYIYDYLMREIGNAYGVCGMMGNWYAESGLRPNNLQNTYETSLGYTDSSYTQAVDNGSYRFSGYADIDHDDVDEYVNLTNTRESFIYDSAGYGLIQWTYWSLKRDLYDYAKSTNRSIGDLDMQLEHAVDMIKKNSSHWKAISEAKTVREASDYYLHNIERPKNHEGNTTKEAERAGYGMTYYNKYASNNGIGGAGGSLKNPLSGQSYRVTSEFGWRVLYGKDNFHGGIDLGCLRNTPVNAAQDGKVITAVSDYAYDEGSSYGNYIVIDHGNNMKTCYAHLDHLESGIAVGSKVLQGQVIGYVDTTGNSTGNHLHFEVRINDERMNPRDFLNF